MFSIEVSFESACTRLGSRDSYVLDHLGGRFLNIVSNKMFCNAHNADNDAMLIYVHHSSTKEDFLEQRQYRLDFIDSVPSWLILMDGQSDTSLQRFFNFFFHAFLTSIRLQMPFC